MKLSLTALQCRVIGVMLEKEITTPDQYPLSLNGLMNGCNQKSAREPVMSLSESEVQKTLDELSSLNLISEQRVTSSRVVKYQHRFCNTEFGDLQFSKQQLAIVCLMLLRGAQTPGELRTRSNRLADFNDVSGVDKALGELNTLKAEPLVIKLPREAGKRESRYAHLLGDEDVTVNNSVSITAQDTVITEPNSNASRILVLEQQVEDLSNKMLELEKVIQQFL